MTSLPTRQLLDLRTLVLPTVPTAPLPLVAQALRSAARQFCIETKIWRHTFTTTVAAQRQALTPPAYSTVIKIESATFDGAPLSMVAFEDVTDAQIADTGTPTRLTQQYPNEVILLPYAAGSLVTRAVLAPASAVDIAVDPTDPTKDLNNVIPEFLFDSYGEAIAYGALGKLLNIPTESIANHELAAYYHALFNKEIGRAQIEAARSQTLRPLRTTPSYM